MKLSLITDEITQSFDESVIFAKQHGLKALEFRTVDDTPIHLIDDDTLKCWKKRLDENGLKTCCLAGSFFKCEMIQNDIDSELEKLELLCEKADILDTKYIRGFTFFAPKSGIVEAKEIAPYFKRPIEILKKYNKTLLLEADPTVNTPTHATLAELIKAIDSPCVAAIFDPGNSIYASPPEQPYPCAYNAIKPFIRHIHIKDSINAKPECYCVKVGDGEVNYPQLLKAIIDDGYDGYFSMETHYRHNVVLTEEQMKRPGGSEFSNGGKEATSESIEALKKLYESIKN